jgi:hypothetical protein
MQKDILPIKQKPSICQSRDWDRILRQANEGLAVKDLMHQMERAAGKKHHTDSLFQYQQYQHQIERQSMKITEEIMASHRERTLINKCLQEKKFKF